MTIEGITYLYASKKELKEAYYKETQKNKWLKETLEICQKENVELRNTIKHLLDYIKEENE